MVKRMRIVSSVFSALGWVALVLGIALSASGLFGMLELQDLPPSEIRDARMPAGSVRIANPSCCEACRLLQFKNESSASTSTQPRLSLTFLGFRRR
jgi:hypothetical protein